VCGDKYRADRLFGLKSDLDALDPTKRNFIAGAVVEFGGARNFVHRHRLGVFERAAGFEVSRDSACPENMTAELLLEPGIGNAAADHPICSARAVPLAAWSAAKDDRGNDEGENRMTLRVPMVSLERARELGEAMGLPARRTQSEAFRVLANNPGVARVAYNQLIQLLENNKFDTRLRELMIMRIGWVTGSAYEWTQHWRVATTAGIPPDDILAVRDWRNSDRLTPADKAILAATDECLAGKSISDAAWAEVVKHVTDPGQQVEFIIAMGNWMMFSLLFRNLRIPLAEGLTVWPPDGLASPAAQG
jgi:alkylhydroperoxidase family enzyme